LSGILKCAHCGAGLRRIVRKGHPRYWCGECYRIAIAQQPTDLWVREAVKERVRGAHLRVRQGKRPRGNLGARIVAQRARMEQIAEEFADDPTITPQQVRTMTQRVRANLEQLLREQERDVDARLSAAITPDLADNFDDSPLDRQRALVLAVVDRVVILPGTRGRRFDPNRIQVEWR
jgi:hypothetical protein